MPILWCIATKAVLAFSQNFEAKGYTLENGSATLYSQGFVDDMCACDEAKKGATQTAQRIIVMEGIFNIRVQGMKSITIFSRACIDNIMRRVRRWYTRDYDVDLLPLTGRRPVLWYARPHSHTRRARFNASNTYHKPLPFTPRNPRNYLNQKPFE